MDIFNKKKVKSLEWDLMATKARLESKESELNRVNNSMLKMFDAIEEAFNNLHANRQCIISDGQNSIKVTVNKFSCQGGTPQLYVTLSDGSQEEIDLGWDEVLTFKSTKNSKKK